MDYLTKLKNNFRSPSWWQRSVFPFLEGKAAKPLSQRYYSPDKKPSKLMDRDWDNAIVLDGCRYDLFEEVNTLDEDLEYRISVGSGTPEFLAENFDDSEYYDTVYVTANPMYRVNDIDDKFHTIIDVWETGWDDSLQTVPPEEMLHSTLEAHERYPNKRILSHFMQPHYPFIGESAAEIGDHSGYERTYRQALGREGSRDAATVWELLERGELSKELVWEAYRENLEIALPHVETLLDHFDERTVVTADHGNGLGERPFPLGKPIYGHPLGVRHDCLCKVPWLVSAGETRKKVVSEPPTRRTVSASVNATDRLADLGYADI